MTVKAFVVEDNAAIRESLIETLEELTGIVTEGFASNEKAAVAWLTDAANAWDIAIVDLVLEPGGSGLGVLHALRSRQRGQKMVVLTGRASTELRQQCEKLGADRVFDKAIDTDALIDYCRQLAADMRK